MKIIVLLFVVLFVQPYAAQSPSELPAAIIVSPPKHTSTLVGKTVRMTCAAYGKPTPSITWARANEDIDAKLSDSSSGYKKYEQTVTVNGTQFRVSVLEICGVVIDDTDEYTCTADNAQSGDGIASEKSGFFLAVANDILQPPSVIVRPLPDGNVVDFGSTVEAVCVAYGNPIPDITWNKDGCASISCTTNAQVFTETVSYGDVSYRKSTLQLCNVDESNSGSYSCSAANGVEGDGVAQNSYSMQLSVNPNPVVPEPSNMMPTLSCPEISIPVTKVITRTESPSPTGNVGRAVGDSSVNSGYLAAIAIEGVLVFLLLIILVAGIILGVKFRGGKSDTLQQKEIKAVNAPVQSKKYTSDRSQGYGRMENEEVEDTADGQAYENVNVGADLEDTNMSYAELVKKMDDDN